MLRRFTTAGIFIPKLLNETGRCILDRGVVSVTGQDAAKFLNGICTIDILKWWQNHSSPGAFTGFLTPQVYSQVELIDCDKRVTGDFIFHLKQYKLRNKVEIQDESSTLRVSAEWNSSNHSKDGLIDRRCDWDMRRMLVEPTDDISTDTTIYHTLRMVKGIPEGPVEITRGKAIPMEFNLDLMHGVDLHKGCYMGQELVTRTLHRGIVRKRIVPFILYEESNGHNFDPNPTRVFEGLDLEGELYPIEPNGAKNIAEITKIEPNRSFGKIVGLLGNVGLALARLEDIPPNGTFAVHRPHLSPGLPTFLIGKVSIPDWWPNSP